MGETARTETKLPTDYKPEEARHEDKRADAAIGYAKAVHDWSALEQAVEHKMAEQATFCAWWDVNVRPPGQGNISDQIYFSVADAVKISGISANQASKWRRRLAEPDKYRDMLLGTVYAKAMAESMATASKWTGDPESYTPAIYIEAAREVMGGIDLDPASNEQAQATVKAAMWYGVEDDGLAHQWHGRVFLNPPYKQPEMTLFAEKLCEGVEAGNVTQAILLTNNNTDTKWWHQCAEVSAGVCFTKGRINFYKSDGTETQPTNGQTFFYFGPDLRAFESVFSQFGTVLA